MATKQVKIGKYDLTLQDPGIGWVLDVEENRAYNPVTQKLSLRLYAQEILNDVVIEPRGLDVEDFETVKQLGDLVRSFKTFRESLATRRTGQQGGAKRPDKPTT